MPGNCAGAIRLFSMIPSRANARHLFADAQAMLDKILTEHWLTARAVIGFFPANRTGEDDIALYPDEGREPAFMTLHHLRQQGPKPAGKPHHCLTDWIAPRETGADYVGAFAVTAGIGIDERVAEFERAHDDYSAILLKALADRLAEALLNGCTNEYGGNFGVTRQRRH